MNYRSSIVFAGVLLISASCSSRPDPPPFEKGSDEYAFFRTVADSIGVSFLDPDRSVPLIESNRFMVSTGSIMRQLHEKLRIHTRDLYYRTPEDIINVVLQVAREEASKRLILTSARDNKIKISDERIDEELQKLYDKYRGNKAFVQKIILVGQSEEQIRKTIEQNQIIEKYFNTIAFAGIDIPEEEIRKDYETEKTVSLRHIVMLTEDKSEAEKISIREKMEKILAKARAGEDFVRLMQVHSEDKRLRASGGLHENVPRGKFYESFEEAAFSIPLGEISDIVETDIGYHIIKVIDRKKETRPYESVREEIRDRLSAPEKSRIYTVLIDSLKTRYEYRELLNVGS